MTAVLGRPTGVYVRPLIAPIGAGFSLRIALIHLQGDLREASTSFGGLQGVHIGEVADPSGRGRSGKHQRGSTGRLNFVWQSTRGAGSTKLQIYPGEADRINFDQISSSAALETPNLQIVDLSKGGRLCFWRFCRYNSPDGGGFDYHDK